MRYICLVHVEGTAFRALSPEARAEIDRRSMAYDESLKAAGHFIEAEALQPAASAVLVKVRDGQMATTDGPFIETKEQLCGFILIEARDLNEAIRIGAGIPLAQIGTIEVRPVLQF